MSELHELAREYARTVIDSHEHDGLNTSIAAEAGRMEQAFIDGYNKALSKSDRGFRRKLEMAQAFQLELSGVKWLTVTVSHIVNSCSRTNPSETFVSIDVHTYKDGELDRHCHVYGSEITEQSLEEIKDNLRDLGYEI